MGEGCRERESREEREERGEKRNRREGREDEQKGGREEKRGEGERREGRGVATVHADYAVLTQTADLGQNFSKVIHDRTGQKEHNHLWSGSIR
jgi:hypothetical protein